MTVTIAGVNDTPSRTTTPFTVTEDSAATTIAVLANDTDPDYGDTKRVIALQTVGLRGTATISSNGSSVIYSVGNAFSKLGNGSDRHGNFYLYHGRWERRTIDSDSDGYRQRNYRWPKANPDNAFTSEDSPPFYIGRVG